MLDNPSWTFSETIIGTGCPVHTIAIIETNLEEENKIEGVLSATRKGVFWTTISKDGTFNQTVQIDSLKGDCIYLAYDDVSSYVVASFASNKISQNMSYTIFSLKNNLAEINEISVVLIEKKLPLILPKCSIFTLSDNENNQKTLLCVPESDDKICLYDCKNGNKFQLLHTHHGFTDASHFAGRTGDFVATLSKDNLSLYKFI